MFSLQRLLDAEIIFDEIIKIIFIKKAVFFLYGLRRLVIGVICKKVVDGVPLLFFGFLLLEVILY